MIRTAIIFALAMCMLTANADGQSKDKYFKIEVGYLSGIGKINYDNQAKFDNQSEANRLRISYGIFIHPKTAIGLGLGLDGYNNPQHNTFPVFLEIRRFVTADESSLFAFLNLGTAVKFGPAFEKGFHLSPGFGYLIKKRKIDILPSIGINIQNIADGRAILIDPSTNQIESINAKITLSSFSFNLGIQF